METEGDMGLYLFQGKPKQRVHILLQHTHGKGHGCTGSTQAYSGLIQRPKSVKAKTTYQQ